MVETAINTGLRWGEIIALKPRHLEQTTGKLVDFDVRSTTCAHAHASWLEVLLGGGDLSMTQAVHQR